MLAILLDIRLPPYGATLLVPVLGVLLIWLAFRLVFRDEAGTGLLISTLVVAALIIVSYPIQSICEVPRSTRTSRAAVQYDLRNLQSAQEIYWGDGHRTYSDDLEELQLPTTDGVRITVTSRDSLGFGAVGTRDRLPEMTCAIYVGEEHQTEPATEPGVVTCDPVRPALCSTPLGALGSLH